MKFRDWLTDTVGRDLQDRELEELGSDNLGQVGVRVNPRLLE